MNLITIESKLCDRIFASLYTTRNEEIKLLEDLTKDKYDECHLDFIRYRIDKFDRMINELSIAMKLTDNDLEVIKNICNNTNR